MNTPASRELTRRLKKRRLVVTLLRLQDAKCAKCARPFGPKRDPSSVRPTLDHVIPKSKGGSNLFVNMVLLCAACNFAKADVVDPEIVAECKRIWRRASGQEVKRACQVSGSRA